MKGIGRSALVTAVVYPCDEASLAAAAEAARRGLIEPILIGPRVGMTAAAARAGIELDGFATIDVADERTAATTGVAQVVAGRASAIMKGSLHTDDLLTAVVHEPALRTTRRMSHCYLFSLDAHRDPFIVSDTVMNIAPTLDEKAAIVQNAIDLAIALGMASPRVAILAAVETVNSKMPATIDAAALAKMADRGQIRAGIVDGPLALDDAIDPEAAASKQIVSEVAGRANVLIVPDLEAGNILAKELEFLGHARTAGVVVGAHVPIILTSRAETIATRVESCVLAQLLARSTLCS